MKHKKKDKSCEHLAACYGVSYNQMASQLRKLDEKLTISARGIIDGLARVAGIASEAGLSLIKTANAIAHLKTITGRSEGVIGNSLRGILSLLSTPRVSDALNSAGIKLVNKSGNPRSPLSIMRDFAKLPYVIGAPIIPLFGAYQKECF